MNGSGPDSAAPPSASAKTAISWDAARDHAGETITIVGPVAGTHLTSDGTHIVLNVGKDYPDRTRFSVYMPAGGGTSDPDATYKGKTIRVTGKVVLYREVPEIQAQAPDVLIEK